MHRRVGYVFPLTHLRSNSLFSDGFANTTEDVVRC